MNWFGYINRDMEKSDKNEEKSKKLTGKRAKNVDKGEGEY